MYNTIVNSSRKLVTLFVILLFSFGLIAGCSGNDKPAKTSVRAKRTVNKKAPQGNNVWMKNLAFVPKVKVIKVGTTVTWINKDIAMHTVQSGIPGKPINTISSKTMGKGQKFSFTFNKKGTFLYFCTTHPTIMQATIIVE